MVVTDDRLEVLVYCLFAEKVLPESVREHAQEYIEEGELCRYFSVKVWRGEA